MPDNIDESKSNIEVVAYPDIRLRSAAREVTNFSDNDYLEVVAKLKEKMAEFDHCVGLAANQIGSDLNLFVADASKNKKEVSKYGFVVLANAEIIEQSGAIQKREGCMSVTDLTVDVTRYETITVLAKDEHGESISFALDGFEARVFQHEIDHLKGKVILDRAKSSKDIYIRKRYTK